ncbi:MAG: inner membrane protein YpjD, partial [Nitrospinales bacterium]
LNMEHIFFNIALISYLVASLGYFVHLVYRKRFVSVLGAAAVCAGLVAQTLVIGIRAGESGHGPYTTSFEVALFCAWLVVVVFFIVEWKYRIKDLGAFVIPLVFLILLYSAFLSQEVNHIPKSDLRLWLTLHRSLSIVGYAAFAMAFVAAVMYLIQENQLKSKKLGMMYFRMPSLDVLDKLNHKVITLGFPLFTLGFMTGSIANMQRDLSFFSWDVVKTWPLVVTWIIYGLVFFGRLLVGWQGKKTAQGAIIGFVAVVFTYFLHV